MSTLDINAIRDYLLKVGCKIEYPILVNSFKQHLYNPDPNVQAKIRTQFKDYVNRLATVSMENKMKYINLRPEFRPQNFQELPAVQSTPPPPPLDITPRDPQRGQQKQVPPLPSPFTTPRTTTQNINQKLPIVVPQQQQVEPMPPPVPQHHKMVAPDIQYHHHSTTLTMPSTVPSVSVQQNSITHYHHNHQRQHSLPQQQQQQAQVEQFHQFQFNNQQQQQQSTPRPLHQIQRQHSLSVGSKPHDIQDSAASMPPPPPPPPLATRRQHSQSTLQQRPESLNLISNSSRIENNNNTISNNGGAAGEMPPPRPPPRRRQSTASLFKQSPRIVEKSRGEIHDLAKKSPGRVKEHALRFTNSFTSSSSDLNSLMPMRSNTMKENRLSRDSTIGGSLSSALQRNGSHLTTRSRSSHREDESDSSSLQPIDPLRRKWAIEACNCNYNGLLTLLREDSKLAGYKDIVNGYTALHWAAKFGNLDIIKLIAGTHGVSANIKSSAGYTPLHVAYMFNRNEAANLLLKSYKANPDIRDHSGKRPQQYCKLAKTTGQNAASHHHNQHAISK